MRDVCLNEYIESFKFFSEKTNRYDVLSEKIIRQLKNNEYLKKENRKNYKIMDLGCGNLKLTKPLLQQINSEFSVEVNPILIDHYREFYKDYLDVALSQITTKTQ
jgi:16S rRNA A1518/A1519 N6-dimethyltransferase RsmA/KsgA/DIM1 with predicted DNA glycosylase/AP lyase activity